MREAVVERETGVETRDPLLGKHAIGGRALAITLTIRGHYMEAGPFATRGRVGDGNRLPNLVAAAPNRITTTR